jgi:hypothetical protein
MAYNKYQEGKIYLIRSPSRPDIDPYYGSTIGTLKGRFSVHISNAKTHNKSSKILIDIGDAIIELVENYPCENKYELECRERVYIENNPCINKFIPTRTRKERRELNKDNKKKYNIEYYEINKREILMQRKKYYEINKRKILMQQQDKYTCICGSIIRHNEKARHERTQRHINYISQ